MTDPSERNPNSDPTSPSMTPLPPFRPQQGPPPSWQQAGWIGTQPPAPLAATTGASVTPARGSTRLRWVVALLGAIVIVAAGVGVAVFAVGSQASGSIGPSFLPATAPLYAEARFDLPGTERDNIIKFIAHFPGFADQSSFDTKIDEALDRWVGDTTSHQLLYTRDLKPWFNGQVAIGLLKLPTMAMPGASPEPGSTAAPAGSGGLLGGMPGMGMTPSMSDVHFIVGIGVKDRARLDTLIAMARSMASGLTFTEQQNGDRTIVSVSNSNGDPQGAYVVTENLLLFAPHADDLATALSVMDGNTPSLADDSAFTAATADLPADRLGEVYAGPAYFQLLDSVMSSIYSMPGMNVPGVAGLAQCLQVNLVDPANASTVAALVAADDHLALQSKSINAITLPVGTSTDLAAHVPSSSLFYLQVPNVGPSVHDLLSCLRKTSPDMFSGDQVQQIEKALGVPLEDELGVLGDVAVSVGAGSAGVDWGLVANVSDQQTAQSRVTTMVSLARVASAAGQSDVTVTDSTVGNTTVSTITIPSASGAAGMLFSSVSVALSDDGHLYLGSGDFVSNALTMSQTDSLAASDRYSSAVTAAGNPNSFQMYVDISGLRQAIESAMPPNPNYTTNIQPYLAPFDRVIVGANQDGTTASSQLLLFVK